MVPKPFGKLVERLSRAVELRSALGRVVELADPSFGPDPDSAKAVG